TVREGQEYQISLTYAGGWEPGLVKKTLTVTTDDPKQPLIKVPVQASVQAEVPGGPGGPAPPATGAFPVAAAPAPLSAAASREVNEAKTTPLTVAQTAHALPAAVGVTEAQAASPAKAQGPVLEIREPIQDGGTVDQGTVVKYLFKATNPGTADLEITNVQP